MKNFKVIFLILLLTTILAAPVHAHRMIIQPIESGIIEVKYADGSFSRRTEVTVYDETDQILEQGKLDEDGRFYFDEANNPSYIIADDGMGHMDTWEVGSQVKIDSMTSKMVKIGLVIAGFLGVALFFSKNKK